MKRKQKRSKEQKVKEKFYIWMECRIKELLWVQVRHWKLVSRANQNLSRDNCDFLHDNYDLLHDNCDLPHDNCDLGFFILG